MIRTFEARGEAIHNAMAYNKDLPKHYLQRLPNKVLICFVHPFDRVGLIPKLGLKPEPVSN